MRITQGTFSFLPELSASLATSFELRGEDLTLGSFPCAPAAAPAASPTAM